MSRRTKSTIAAVIVGATLGLGSSPALAHGGSVTPAAEGQDCRNLDLNEKGQAGHAVQGLSTAGEHGAAARWGHCG